MSRTYFQDNQKNIISLYLDGKTTKELAFMYYISDETIRQLLHLNNIDVRTNSGHFKIGHKNNIGKKRGAMSSEQKYKIGFTRRGKTLEEIHGVEKAKIIKLKMNHEGTNNPRYGKHWSEEHKLNQSQKMKIKWQDKVWVLNHLKKLHTHKINKTEKILEDFLKDYNYKFVGDGKFWIGYPPRNPDFINIKEKKIIEFFGNFWHKKEDENNRIKHYKKYGWKTYIIWGSDLRFCPTRQNHLQNVVKEKVKEVCEL